MNKKIHFSDLDGWLKAAIIITYIIAGIYGLSILFQIVLSFISSL